MEKVAKITRRRTSIPTQSETVKETKRKRRTNTEDTENIIKKKSFYYKLRILCTFVGFIIKRRRY